MTGVRLDRLISLGAARLLATRRAAGAPILMYHSVSDAPVSGAHPYYEITTAPGQFRDHMRILREGGYTGISLAELTSAPVSGRRVAITFDDGYRDNLTAAWPVLREHGYAATIFLVTDAVGKSFKDRACLTWDEVRQMRREGAAFGSHTASHPELVQLGDAEIEREWKTSKASIEDHLGERINLFSYPYAFPEANARFVGRLRLILENLGFERGVTTVLGTFRARSDPFFLPRLPVNDGDDARLFSAKLDGSYDWMHGPQRFYKRVKQFMRAP